MAEQDDAVEAGIVLAGGSGRRLGTAVTAGKASLQLEGSSFLGLVCRAVAETVGRIVVVARPGQRLPAIEAQIVHDATPGAGPLAALRDGIRATCAAVPRLRRVLVVACDVPRVRPEVLRVVLDAARPIPGRPDAVWTVPVVHGHQQVLLSVMDVRLLPRIEAWLESGRRDPRGLLAALLAEDAGVIRLVDERRLLAVDGALESFIDVDTPEDLDRLRAR